MYGCRVVGNDTAQEILLEWFGELDASGLATAERRQRWWRKDEQFDSYLRDKYEPLVKRALAGELEVWLEQPQSTLALILLLDQITRNIYRDQPEMYLGDARALKALDRLLHAGADQQLVPEHRAFAYMPLMHAESMHRQQQALDQFAKLRDAGDATHQAHFGPYYDFAVKHADIIRRFGRFPHRNPILERTSTAEELEFMLEPGSSF